MQNRRSHLVLVALILLGLLGAGGLFWKKEVTLGLDLQGGLEVVLRAVPPKNHPLTKSDIDRSISIMRSRIDKTGVAEPEIRQQGKDQIVIQLPGVHNASDAAKLIGKTAQLELFDLEADLVPPSIDTRGSPRASQPGGPGLYGLLAAVQVSAKKGSPTAWYLFDKSKRILAGPVDSRGKLFNRKRPTVPKGGKVFAVPGGYATVTCDATARFCPDTNGGFVPPLGDPARKISAPKFYYLFKYQPDDTSKPVPEMTGKDLKLSGTRQDFDPTTGEAIVLMQFTGKGGKKFHEITRQEAIRGRLRGTEQHFAIVLDREIKSFPSIDYQQYPGGIDAVNGAQITGIRSIKEAKDLAIVLQTGALPVNFVQIERTDVSATLGKDSLAQAKRAALIGFIIVALFLLVLYRFLGLVAVIGLAIYAAFLYAAILIFNVTLTLPGFAGLILTIGVAADANVVVFERIKEEVRAGKSVRAAIGAGYAKGFRTILDANVVTCITALVLFAVATASVKGFALMLLVGTVISLLTAVAATRAMLGLLAGFRWFENPRFMGAHGQQGAKWLQIDFMRRRYLWLALAGLVILVSSISLGVRSLNFGIDFKGGTQITFKTAKPYGVDDVRDETRKIGQGGAQVQGRGASTDGKYKSFQIRTKALSAANQDKLTTDLQDRLDARALGVKNVSSSFGRQIARDAVLAIFVSLLLIVLYIGIRFDLKYAGPVIVALLHDILITVGVYSLTGREVSTSTVAAVLTVLGYSIYDTIIIFDRIRENVPLMRRASFATITNVSLWETIRRSLATTFITLLPVTSLLLFGGETLKDFAFALLVGIASGAYSSIFIAAPLLTMWKEREPEYRRRMHLAPGEELLDGVVTAGGPRKPFPPRKSAPVDAGTAALEQATEAAAAQPTPTLGDLIAQPTASGGTKRDQRRQRRKTRPHGRAR